MGRKVDIKIFAYIIPNAENCKLVSAFFFYDNFPFLTFGNIKKYIKYIYISFRGHDKKCKLTLGDIKMYQEDKLDFTAFGQAVKKAREEKGISRESVAEMVDLAPRYLMYIETRGQHPSLQKLYELAKLFDISVDQFLFPDTIKGKSTLRRQLDTVLDSIDEKELIIVSSTAKAILKAKKERE